jgi:hypothetical protein
MRKVIVGGVVLAVVMALVSNAGRGSSPAGDKVAKTTTGKGQLIAHNVYFALKDNSPAAKEKLVAACKKYLSKHPGEVFFAAGVLARDLDRPVNDREFDVALHIVFVDRKAHDVYQDAPRHKDFIAENKDNWKKVRVFDSEVER